VDETTRVDVQEYYGSTLQKSEDLQTNACSTAGTPPAYVQRCLKNIHPQVLSKYYGCGLCLPAYDLTGCSILDLGCGAGRDVYIGSQLVGESGSVVGVDMTTEQLATAQAYRDYHAEAFGFKNTRFLQGYLESLDALEGLQPESFDLIISNCVLNLCIDKPAVLNSCYKLLKPGGEMYFSDVYANRRVPIELQKNKVLWGECVSGALYWNDFVNIAKRAGFSDPRLVEDSPITLGNKKMQELVGSFGDLRFYSATYRLLKLDGLEPACEDYGQAVLYKGSMRLGRAISAKDENEEAPSSIDSWTLDKHHVFECGKVVPVCGNTYRMLRDNPRSYNHFDFFGTWDRHYGIFEGCGSSLPFDAASSAKGKGGEALGSCC
jgi:arsenite methyltransferase